MNWVWFIGGTWLAVGIALAVIIGRSIHLANLRATHAPSEDAFGVPGRTPGLVMKHQGAPVRRSYSSPNASAYAQRMGKCVSSSERATFDHEHGVL